MGHHRSRKLSDLLALLKSYFQIKSAADEGSDVLIWLDIFACNQNPYAGGARALQEDIIEGMSEAIKAADRTLLCLDSECVVLSRIWCAAASAASFVSSDVVVPTNALACRPTRALHVYGMYALIVIFWMCAVHLAAASS